MAIFSTAKKRKKNRKIEIDQQRIQKPRNNIWDSSLTAIKNLISYQIRINIFHAQIIGPILLSLSIFCFICFISYNDLDPSFNAFQKESMLIHNWGGVIGASVADIFLQTLGLGSYLFLAILFYFGLHLVFKNDNFLQPSRLLGLIFLIISSTCLLSMTSETFITTNFQIYSGGVTGVLIANLLLNYFNLSGTIILLAGLLILSIYLTFRVSVFLILKQLFFASIHIFGDKITQKNLFKWSGKKSKKVSICAKESKNKSLKNNTLSKSMQPKEQKPARSLLGLKKKIKKTPKSPYIYPKTDLLSIPIQKKISIKEEDLLQRAEHINRKLKEFGVLGQVVQINPGPVVTVYEFELGEGIRTSKVTGLSDDLALALSAENIRIDRVVGKNVLGIEVPNKDRETVYLREILESDTYRQTMRHLPLALGKNIHGQHVGVDLTGMPHLLVAGATGTGKSVTLNSMLCSLLMKTHPNEMKLILIDPKMLEFSMYDHIPHLLLPVVTIAPKASASLKWAVNEMEKRYVIMKDSGTLNIYLYNEKIEMEEGNNNKKLPYIVIIIDELADLMMVAPRDIEDNIMRLSQKARAAGIHLILATQRPSVNVITGVIKANLPSRIACQVTSKVDSRTILDCIGAESLLGKGDMLFMSSKSSRLERIHGAFVSDKEVLNITNYLRSQSKAQYDDEIVESIEQLSIDSNDKDKEDFDETNKDDKYDEAVAFAAKQPFISVSALQRNFQIGFNRAARLIDIMETEGVVGPAKGSKPREVLVSHIPNN